MSFLKTLWQLLILVWIVSLVACASVDSFNRTASLLTRDAITATEDHRCTVHAPPCLSDDQFRAANVVLNRISVAGQTFTQQRLAGTASITDTSTFLARVSEGVSQLSTAFPTGAVVKVLEKLTELQQKALRLLQ